MAPERAGAARVYLSRSTILPILARHSPALALTKPWPLQTFWPLHLFSAVAQSLVPLQLLMPAQWTTSLATTLLVAAMADEDMANRSLLLDRLNQGISLARRGNDALVVAFIDLDDFKLVNDNLGHGPRRCRSCARSI